MASCCLEGKQTFFLICLEGNDKLLYFLISTHTKEPHNKEDSHPHVPPIFFIIKLQVTINLNSYKLCICCEREASHRQPEALTKKIVSSL